MRVIQTPTSIMHHIYLADMAGCGYIRCIFPSMLLSQYTHGGRVNFLPSYGMHFINDADYYKNLFFVMFQRSATPAQLNLIKHFRKTFRGPTKTPLLYEIDDLLTNIPEWNFASDYYKQHSPTAIEIMKNVDGITVSTNRLKEIYSQFNTNIEVSKNHLVKGFWGEPNWNGAVNKKPKILWAGSGNHFSQKDNVKGGDFGNELIKFILKTVDKYEWHIMGGIPLELKQSKVIKHNWLPLFNYHSYIKSLNINLAIAPLEHNLFNECKSNIKSLEYTAAGIPAIYTNIEPYKDLTELATNDEQMINKIELFVNDSQMLSNLWNSDCKRLRPQLFWEENDNIPKYYNKMIGFFDTKLPK